MRAGKDTFAKMVVEYYDALKLVCEVHHFADALKEIVSSIKRKIVDDFMEFTKSKTMLSTDKVNDIINMMELILPAYSEDKSRNLLQWFGTDLMREKYDEDFWTAVLKYRIRSSQANIAVVADARYLNELCSFDKDSELVIHKVYINASRQTLEARGADMKLMLHSSELMPMDEFEVVLLNDFVSKEKFRAAVFSYLEGLNLDDIYD